jgi:hypothetical protein
MDKYRVIDYFDVWGNETDGWEVNNLAEVGYITVKDYTDKEEIIRALVNINFLGQGVLLNLKYHLENLEVWNDYDMIEFHSVQNQKPLFRLERVLN